LRFSIFADATLAEVLQQTLLQCCDKREARYVDLTKDSGTEVLRQPIMWHSIAKEKIMQYID
jgi:hypothetical protein